MKEIFQCKSYDLVFHLIEELFHATRAQCVYLDCFVVFLNQKKDLIKDYHEMRQLLESIGCFEPSACFYSLYFIHIILLEVIAYVVLIQFQLSCLTFLLSGFLIAAAQVSICQEIQRFL